MAMEFDASVYPYPSRRRTIFARNGMVCTGQPLAAQAGLRMLLQGGNAIDAALATAICLTVVEPNCNGLGSDAFALVWVKDHQHRSSQVLRSQRQRSGPRPPDPGQSPGRRS